MASPKSKEIAKQGSSESVPFDDLYATYYSGLVRFACTYLGDSMLAEDLVAESFMAYWERRSQLDSGVNVKAYIMTSLKHRCLNYLRDKKLHDAHLQRLNHNSMRELELRITTLEACDPAEIFPVELQQMVDRALRKLPTRTLEAFMLSRYQQKSHREIAESMGISVKGVEFHISKALALLRIALKDYLPVVLVLLSLF